MCYVTSLTFILSGSPDLPASQATSDNAKESRNSAAANLKSSRLNFPASQATNATAEERGSLRETATSNNQSANASPPSLQPPDPRSARAAARALAGINEHCATSLLSLSFLQVQGKIFHAVSVRRCALAVITEHCATSLVSLSFFQVPYQAFQKCRRQLPSHKALHALLARRKRKRPVSCARSHLLRRFSHFLFSGNHATFDASNDRQTSGEKGGRGGLGLKRVNFIRSKKNCHGHILCKHSRRKTLCVDCKGGSTSTLISQPSNLISQPSTLI